MIPRILVNNIQYIKKCILVSVCFYLVEHIPSVDRMIMVTQAPVNKTVNEPTIDTTDESVTAVVTTTNTTEEPHLILLWTEYQMIGKNIYKTIFSRISNNECPISNCRFTTDRSLQNQSSAIIFHMPNLHWENYTYPQYRSVHNQCIMILSLFFLTIFTRHNLCQIIENYVYQGKFSKFKIIKINVILLSEACYFFNLPKFLNTLFYHKMGQEICVTN